MAEKTLIYMAGNRPAERLSELAFIKVVGETCASQACASVRARGNRGRDGTGPFFKVGLATATCAQVCVGAFMKTLTLKCVCKCACVHGLPRCSWSCDGEHCVREYGALPTFLFFLF